MTGRRPLAVPRYRHRHERAFGADGLDLKLAMHVRSTGGFFVEAGANDGVTQSNTLLFARYRGWRGLLIEPVPELARRCRAARPESIVEQVALVAPDHAALGEQRQGVAGSELAVPARTLGAVLDAHGVERIDLLCLDLGGHEPDALRGLDLERHRPAWLLVEVCDGPAIDELLAPRYEPVAELSHHGVVERPRRDVLYRLRSAVSRA